MIVCLPLPAQSVCPPARQSRYLAGYFEKILQFPPISTKSDSGIQFYGKFLATIVNMKWYNFWSFWEKWSQEFLAFKPAKTKWGISGVSFTFRDFPFESSSPKKEKSRNVLEESFFGGTKKENGPSFLQPKNADLITSHSIKVRISNTLSGDYYTNSSCLPSSLVRIKKHILIFFVFNSLLSQTNLNLVKYHKLSFRFGKLLGGRFWQSHQTLLPGL